MFTTLKPSSLGLQGLILIQTLVSGFSLPVSDVQSQPSERSANTVMQRELASIICRNSTILTPSDANWTVATARFMQNVRPQVQLLVRPGCESDVQKIVRYANNHSTPFYTVNRGHAWTTSVGKFKGIEIDLGNLNKFFINADKKTAHFQGGVYAYEVVPALWEQGYLTASGGCSCVSILGPALGGGHGVQQGKHGLTMDQFVNLNVVLANGTAARINATSHPDLWWAMRGAGHNFGIVTSFDSKIWPDESKNYYIKTYQFSGRTLEPLIEQVNKFQGNGTMDPVWLASFGGYGMNTTLNKNETSKMEQATISWYFVHGGASSSYTKTALKPFDQLSPLSVKEATVPYNTLFDQLGSGLNSSVCVKNRTHIFGTAYLQVYNVTTMRAIYDLYNKKIGQEPRLTRARFLLEGYGVRAVKGFSSKDSAYPFRDQNILTAFEAEFDTPDDPLIGFASKWRDQTMALLNLGQPGRKESVYVNYAAGHEPLESRYGYEPWRLDKLRKLKSQYDPQNKFAWYNPLVST